MTALEMGKQIQSGELSCLEATKAALEQMQRKEPQIGAFAHVLAENALAQAAQVQQRIDNDELTSPLAGVPMAVTDDICTRGFLTTAGSKMLTGFCPPYSATAYERLERSGAILLGKLNMDEFGMGSGTSFYGASKNPWEVERTPGGSGCGAAVAAGEVRYALGCDTTGALRQAGGYCGVSALRPTYGAVSRYGVVALASSMDQLGVAAADVQDCAAVLQTLEGKDPLDGRSTAHDKWKFVFDGRVQGLKIGIPESYFAPGLDEAVHQAVLSGAKELEKMGATLVPLDIPHTNAVAAASHLLCCAEASSNLSRFDGVKFGFHAPADSLQELVDGSRSQGFGREVKRRILLGNFALSAAHYQSCYQKATQVRALIQEGLAQALHQCDLILSPVSPTTAKKLSEGDPLAAMEADLYTAGASLAGLPAASLPCGFDQNGLPIGLQLTARAFDEPTLVRVADAFQKQTDYHKKTPGGAKQ